MSLGAPFTPIRQRRNSTPDPATLARASAPHASPLNLVTAVPAPPAAPIMPPLNGLSASEVHAWVDTFEKIMIHHCQHLTVKNTDRHRAETFALYVAKGSPAEAWYRGLGPTVQESWLATKAVLGVKWVPPEPRVPGRADHWREFCGLTVSLDDLVRLVPIATGGVRYGYVDWIDKVELAGENCGSAHDILIATVVKDLLPKDVSGIVPPAAQDWSTFCALVRAQLPETVQERVNEAKDKIALREALAALLERSKVLETRLAEQEQRVASPRGRGYPSTTPPPGYQSREHSSSPRRRTDGWYFGAVPAATTPATPGAQRVPAPILPRAPATPSPTPTGFAPRTLGSPFPSTPQRRQREPVTQTPGTLPPAVGCTRCGMGEHSAYSCTGKPLPEAEQRWREGERRRAYWTARSTYNSPGPGPGPGPGRTPYAQQALVDDYYYSEPAGNCAAVYNLNDDDEYEDELDFIHGGYGLEQGNGDGVTL